MLSVFKEMINIHILQQPLFVFLVPIISTGNPRHGMAVRSPPPPSPMRPPVEFLAVTYKYPKLELDPLESCSILYYDIVNCIHSS